MDKLELKHLSCYLPYGLKVSHPLGVFNLNGLRETDMQMALLENESDVLWGYLYEVKPILRPLSDYYDITSPAMKELNLSISDLIALANIASGIYHTSELPYRLICRLAEEHIDFMGLITAGLAVSYREAGL